MTTARAWPLKRAYDEVVRCSGSHFDPDCVRVFCEKWQGIEEIARTLRDDEEGSTI